MASSPAEHRPSALAEGPGAISAGYRPELDVVRFLAFVLVFVHHVLPRDRVTVGVFASTQGSFGDV
jgi:peptidoglycan/LPS O-acetylase OafA/YrhL